MKMKNKILLSEKVQLVLNELFIIAVPIWE